MTDDDAAWVSNAPEAKIEATQRQPSAKTEGAAAGAPTAPTCGQEHQPKSRDSLERAKDWLAIVQSAMTIGALGLGAVWFVLQRQDIPRLKIDNQITHRKVASDEYLLIVDLNLSNVGNVRIDLPCERIWVYQVLPKVDANLLVDPGKSCSGKYHWLEPGEADQVHEEYTIYGNVQTVEIESFAYRDVENGIGWGQKSIYDLTDTNAKRQ
jgi:hypothetical protein